tara:strand:- start:2778 stop:3203 length:426 start_codon:yes stop_codon:yes gene_type:complete
MKKIIYIINGPNLNLLGKREVSIYGNTTIHDIERECKQLSLSLNFELIFLQSNSEAQIIEWVHQAINKESDIIINAAAYTHTSIAILDALKVFKGRVVEVHLSDIKNREDFRKFSYISLRADKVFMGEGLKGYLSAIKYLF